MNKAIVDYPPTARFEPGFPNIGPEVAMRAADYHAAMGELDFLRKQVRDLGGVIAVIKGELAEAKAKAPKRAGFRG